MKIDEALKTIGAELGGDVKHARADLAGAEKYYKDPDSEEFDIDKAAEIYIKNAAKRMFEKDPDKLEVGETKKIAAGLGSTFRATEKAPVPQEIATDFKAAVKKGLEEYGYTTKGKQKAKKAK